MSSELQDLHPDHRPLAAAFVAWLRQHGLHVKITSVLRTSDQQAELHAAAQRAAALGLPHLPAAPPGHSLHERGLAWDMVVSPARFLPVVGHIWEQLGGRWGGRFKDPVHFDFGKHPACHGGNC